MQFGVQNAAAIGGASAISIAPPPEQIHAAPTETGLSRNGRRHGPRDTPKVRVKANSWDHGLPIKYNCGQPLIAHQENSPCPPDVRTAATF